MKTVNVITIGGTLSATKIRYINYGISNYIIYTLNEKDEEGYIKLFINKIVDNDEYMISDVEWDNLKTFIPPFVKEIRANQIKSFKDLNIDDIKAVHIDNSRAFKLKEEIVNSIIYKEPEIEELNLLGKEITELFQEEKTPEEKSLNKLEEFLKNPIMEDPEEIESPIKPDNLKSDLELAQDQIEKLEKEKEELLNKVSLYENKINEIKRLLN
jgi:hypothetical protein